MECEEKNPWTRTPSVHKKITHYDLARKEGDEGTTVGGWTGLKTLRVGPPPRVLPEEMWMYLVDGT